MSRRTGLRSPSVQKAVKKPINYLMGFQQVAMLKCRLLTVHGVLILECSATNTALSGWWITMPGIKEKYKHKQLTLTSTTNKNGKTSLYQPRSNRPAKIYGLLYSLRFYKQSAVF